MKIKNIIIGIVILVVILLYFGFDTKKEIFECNINQNTCNVITINYYGQEQIKPMPAPNLYKDIKIQHHRENRRARYNPSSSYDVYYLYYEEHSGHKGRLFERKFIIQPQAEDVANEIKQQLKNAKTTIRYEI